MLGLEIPPTDFSSDPQALVGKSSLSASGFLRTSACCALTPDPELPPLSPCLLRLLAPVGLRSHANDITDPQLCHLHNCSSSNAICITALAVMSMT